MWTHSSDWTQHDDMVSFRVFNCNLFGFCGWVTVFSQYASAEYTVQTFDGPTIQYPLQYYTCSTVFIPFIPLTTVRYHDYTFYVIGKFGYFVIIYFSSPVTPFIYVVSKEWSAVLIILTDESEVL